MAVALITGASSGIGEATARRLAREPGIALVLVARREERLRALARELGGANVVAVDLTDRDGPARILDAVMREHGQLHMLVNNAGCGWRGSFAETGSANVARHMQLNFQAPVRLTEALLPLLRETARASAAGARGRRREASAAGARGRRREATPDGAWTSARGRVSIVNVASTAARVSRAGSGAYSASKFAFAGWSDALHLEERPHGVHVGLVLPGFVDTESFPAAELLARPTTRWIVSSPERVAEAIMQAGPGGKAERYAPRPYWLAAAARLLAPALVRRALLAGVLTPSARGLRSTVLR